MGLGEGADKVTLFHVSDALSDTTTTKGMSGWALQNRTSGQRYCF